MKLSNQMADDNKLTPSAHDLRVMAASLECPGDLTVYELKQAHSDIIDFLIADADGCEPDARKYKCEECGHREVYGAEETMMMGAF